MSEGRRTQVVLLDDRRVELVVQPKLISGDLLDLVVSYFSLKEKEFFGLAFVDDTGHFNWLQLDRKVLDHEFPRKTGTLSLYFQVQFFIESISHLRDSITIELFYLQAKSALFKGDIEVDSETAFELASYVLQATDGDHASDQKARNELKKLPVLPQSTLKEHPSLQYCEERILFFYKRLGGLSRGQCIVCYMQLAESLPTYGVHYYEVKDKSGIPWWLGLSYKGIGQYDLADRVTPRKVFQWRQLQNIYYRERKFSIEVIDPRRVSVSKRTFGASNATVHAWYGPPVLIQSMWAMAVSQHQFYLDKKHTKERYPPQHSFSKIATDLTISTGSLTTSSQASQASDYSSGGISVDTGTGTGDSRDNLTVLKDAKEKQICSSRELLALEGEAARKEMIMALKARKDALEERLRERIADLKKVCVREAELTGDLPLDYPRIPGEGLPHIKKRVVTAFTLSDKTVNAEHQSAENRQLSQLEVEQEIQAKITTAARKLADDPTISKKMRKTRRESYKTSVRKLSNIEEQLKDMRIRLGLDLPDKMAPKAEQEDMEGFDYVHRKASVPNTPPTNRSIFSRDRSRSKSKNDSSSRLRSKSVPRQLLNGGWRSPSAARKNKVYDQQRRPSQPVDIYSDVPQNSTSSLPRRIKDGIRSRSKSNINFYENVGKGRLKSAKSEERLRSARSEEFLGRDIDERVGTGDVVFSIGPEPIYNDITTTENVYKVNPGSESSSYRVNSVSEPSYNVNSGPDVGYFTSTSEHGYNNNPLRQEENQNIRHTDNQKGHHENPYESVDSRGNHTGSSYNNQSPTRYQRPLQEYGQFPPTPIPPKPRSKTPVSYTDSYARPPSGRVPPTYNGSSHNGSSHSGSSHNGSPRRHKLPGTSSGDRPPPPPYNRTLPKNTGRYYESPDVTMSQRDNYDPPPMRQHAASLHDLQLATRMRNLSHTDDDIEYHQQNMSHSQPPSPKKHSGSMGNLLNIKSSHMSNQQMADDEPDFNNYAPYRSRNYYHSQQQQQYHSYNSRGSMQQHESVTQRYEFEEVNSFINQPYDQRTNIDHGSSSSTHSSDRDLMPPPPSSPGGGDHHRRRHNSFSSNQSTSSHSSSHSSITTPAQVNSAPFHVQQNPAFNRLTEYSSNYASMSHTASYSSISSQNSSASSSAASMYPEPQPAAVYRTTSSMVLRPQPAIGSGIAVSKVHYQPVAPMTCEPVSRTKRLAHGSVSRATPDSFPPAPSEDGSYQGDAGESLADAFSEEMLTWFDEQEGVVKSGTLV